MVQDLPEWYREKRRDVTKTFARAEPGERTQHFSHSGRCWLEVTRFSTGPNTWAYSRCRVFAGTSEHPLAVVDRNFGPFPFSWSEDHPSGHDYLVCGEDYQGQTVIELDTGRRVDHIDAAAEAGWGFCWVAHYPSPCGRWLFVEGCVWAAPYELVLFDFSAPLVLPYPELGRWPIHTVHGWHADGSFVFEYTVEVRRSDDVPLDELSEEERDAVELSASYRELVRERRYRACWRPGQPAEMTPLD